MNLIFHRFMRENRRTRRFAFYGKFYERKESADMIVDETNRPREFPDARECFRQLSIGREIRQGPVPSARRAKCTVQQVSSDK